MTDKQTEERDWNSEFWLEANKNKTPLSSHKQRFNCNTDNRSAIEESSTSRMSEDMKTEPITRETNFVGPRRVVPFSQLIVPIPSPTTTANRFANIQDTPIFDEQPSTRINNPKNATPSRTRKNKPPPIVIQGITSNHRQLVHDISLKVKNGFHIRYVKKSTLIYIEDMVEYCI